VYPGLSREDLAILNEVKAYTMTDVEKIHSMIQGARYVVEHGIPGSIVECGVWKGGSMMAAAKALVGMGSYERELYLFDTFEGMVEPTDADLTRSGLQARDRFEELKSEDGRGSDWCRSEVDEVRRNLASVGYDDAKIHLVKGKVEDTIPEQAPESISLLRLDTDWYESTRHELVHLYPRLSVGGLLIIDDYGAWQGCRKAVDEYVTENRLKLFLTPLEKTGRIAVKLEA